jgi:hypothetical protein
MLRMRLIHSVVSEIHVMDPQSYVNEHFVRCLILEGKVPSIKVGNRYLINLDYFIDYLATASSTFDEETKKFGIRMIQDGRS